MKIRYVIPSVYVDVNVWFVYECPLTKEAILFKTPMNLTLIAENPTDKLKAELSKKYNAEIELEDLGYWQNLREKDGSFIHPFTQERITNHQVVVPYQSESLSSHTPKGSPDFSENAYNRDEVKNTCEKITCPVITSAVLKRGAR